jgi:hypothetical protein
MTKLPARYGHVFTPLILSIFMSCVVSGISTLSSLGLVPDMPSAWMRAWGISWLIAFPALLVVLPLVRRVVAVFVDAPSP